MSSPAGVRLFGGDRRALRLSAGATRRPTRPDRGMAARVITRQPRVARRNALREGGPGAPPPSRAACADGPGRPPEEGGTRGRSASRSDAGATFGTFSHERLTVAQRHDVSREPGRLLGPYSGGTAPISLANPSPSRSTQVSTNLPCSMRCQLTPVRFNKLPVGVIPRTSPS